MNQNIVDKINSCGLQKKFLADLLGVSNSTFSMYISKERVMPDDKLIKLKDILSKQETLNQSLKIA